MSKQKVTRRERFLGEMQAAVPWARLVALIEPFYPHAICGVKRCRIVLDTFRCWRRGLVDEVMLAASGLQNLRVTTRVTA